MSIDIVEGWTERIRQQLLSDGAAQNLSGMTIALVARSRTGSTVTLTGTAGVATAATGIVYFDPAATDLKAADSPLLIRWQVTDGNGKIAFYPNAEPEQWAVHYP